MRLFYLLGLFCLQLLPLYAPAGGVPKKTALLIAISDYPNETGWPDLSCEKDLQLLEPVLRSQGFDNIILIKDKDADRPGIARAFHSLAEQSQPGDIVFFHYSGHGQQIFDDNGDEVDGLDESIVAYGAPAEYVEGYKGDKHVRDDELGFLIDEVRKKLGGKGQMIGSIDACHSGTATRGLTKIRGGKGALVPPGFQNPKAGGNVVPEQGFGAYQKAPASRGIENEKALLVIYSASAFDEENSETSDDNGNNVGSLSYAMAKSLSSCGSGKTYRGLFADVLGIMNNKVPQQTPMVEGDLDYQLFGGSYVRQQSFFNVKEIKNSQHLLISMGRMNGVSDSSVIDIFPSNTISTEGKEPLGRGYVVHADAFVSELVLEKPIQETDKSKLWAFVKEQRLPASRYKVWLDKPCDAATEKQLSDAIGRYPQLMLQQFDMNALIKHKGNYIYIEQLTEAGPIDSFITAAPGWAGEVAAKLKSLAQTSYLKNIQSSSATLDVGLVMFLLTGKDTVKCTDAVPAFNTSQRALVQVVNRSAEKIYFNIIDFQPDGVMNPVVPGPDELTAKHAEQYVLEPNSSKYLPGEFTFAPPYGKEVFKVFASTEPFNLTPVILAGGQTHRGFQKPIEQMVNGAFGTNAMRGVSFKKASESKLVTTDFIFKIQP